ncbi:MAG: nucleotidyl transferase AbiEii/AbiGii toxin family protein [Acidimicrobiia bacterium]
MTSWALSQRLCYFPEYRYSADIDLNVASHASYEDMEQFLDQVLEATRSRVGLPHLQLNPGLPLSIDFIGPKQTKKPRGIKIDITGDELPTGGDTRLGLLHRYEDQVETPPIRVYSLEESAAEKLRSIMQRLQCRDLYDIWHLLESSGVEAVLIKPDFEAKTRHRNLDPDGSRVASNLASTNTADAGLESYLPTWHTCRMSIA